MAERMVWPVTDTLPLEFLWLVSRRSRRAEPDKVREHIGLSGQNAAVAEYLTGFENCVCGLAEEATMFPPRVGDGVHVQGCGARKAEHGPNILAKG
jgi:hypothetical protein